MTKGAFGVMMIVMMNVARLSGAQYSVELEPDTAKRKVIAIGYGARTAELWLHPEVPWRIGSSRIAAQDDFLWSGPYGSYGTSDPTPHLHRYLMLNAHSSREYVKITGVLTQDGAGGTPPWFRVTVPAVDIDWAGYESAAQENDEDTRKLFCPVTEDMSKRRKLVIRNPLDSGKLRDDPSLLGSNPDMRLTLASGYADCFRLLKADGSVFNTGNFNISNIPSWPLELYVDALPNKPPSEFIITLEGPAGPDGARTLDKIRGSSLTIELKVTHPQNPGPTGSAAKYNNTPNEGSADNLFATWPNEQFRVNVNILPTSFANNLPEGFIKWSVAGYTIPDNTTEHTFSWTSTGIKEITVEFPSSGITKKIRVDVPGVGILSQGAAATLIGTPSVFVLANAQEAIDYSNNNFSVGPQRDAFRHAYWMSLSVSQLGVAQWEALLISTGHEHDNRDDDHQQAFNSTMDLHNNSIGSGIIHTTLMGTPDTTPIRNDVIQQYTNGGLWIWAGGGAEGNSEGILVKSNGTKIYSD